MFSLFTRYLTFNLPLFSSFTHSHLFTLFLCLPLIFTSIVSSYTFASFGFKRGYGVKDRLGFILTEIKRYYNSNDRWKFILLLIRRENGLNKWLKHVKRGYGKQTK